MVDAGLSAGGRRLGMELRICSHRLGVRRAGNGSVCYDSSIFE